MRSFLVICVVLGLSGCAPMQKGDGGIFHDYAQSRKLAEANDQLAKGDTVKAIRLLTAICDSRGVAKVTDEALFRLALLSFGPSPERDGNQRAAHLLKRLQKEYPASPWTVQAAPLIEFLNGVDELRRQNKNYKNANQSLSRENKELNQMIERLKRLDLELEKRNR